MMRRTLSKLVFLALLALGVWIYFLFMTTSIALSASQNWYVDDGCGPGLGSGGYFYAPGDPGGYQVRTSGYNSCSMSLIAYWGGGNNPEWFLPVLDPAYQGIYSNNAFVEAQFAPRTQKARYVAFGNGHAAGVTNKFFLNHNVNHGGYCYTL
jgi:hypothetical protein